MGDKKAKNSKSIVGTYTNNNFTKFLLNSVKQTRSSCLDDLDAPKSLWDKYSPEDTFVGMVAGTINVCQQLIYCFLQFLP